MKKIILVILVLSLGVVVTAQAKQLWEYGIFPERAEVAESIGIDNYEGTYDQNLLLLEYYESQFDSETFGSTLPIAGSTYTLAGSGITSSATSVTLQSLTIPQNGYEIQDSDLSDTFYITLEPGSTRRQEIASCTTLTQNANDTATFSGCTRGLSPITPYTASTTLRFAHAGGTQVIFSDPPQLFGEYISLSNDETVTGKKTFNVLPESLLLATTTNQFAIKQYVDNIVNQGAATSTEAVAGISELATRVENASSTAWGVNDPHVQQSEHATSTPSDNAFTDGVVWDIWSENDGKLNQLWFDLTESIDFTGIFQLDGVTLSGIGATATGTALTTLTTGSTTPADFFHTHQQSMSYWTTTTPSTITGETESTILTKTITGTDMGETGILRMTINGSANGGNAPFSNLIIKFGGETIATSTGIAVGEWKANIDIYNKTQSTQYAIFTLISDVNNSTAEKTQASSTTMTINTTIDQTLLITADNSNGSDSITIDVADIQLIK